MPKIRTLGLVSLFTPLLYSAGALANCDFSQTEILRGQTRAILICAAGLSPESQLRGLEQSGITIAYRQNLRRCDFHNRSPGMLLELNASALAQSAEVEIVSELGELVCTQQISVPNHRLLTQAELIPLDQPEIYELQLTDSDAVLSQSCDTLRFPPHEGPQVTLEPSPPKCTANTLSATVRIEAGLQKNPYLLIDVADAQGHNEQGLSFIELPPPHFADDMREEDARYVNVNGIRTRYFEAGSGETLVLVHGGQPSAPDFNAWEWQQNIAGLARQYRVIVPDRIGQGYTDNPPDLDAYADYYPLVVTHLLGFLDALNLEKVHLVGHSQGGWPTARITLDNPDRVHSLTIVDSTMIAKSANAGSAVRFYMYHQNELHPASGPTRQSVRRGLESFSYTGNNITEQRIDRILAIADTAKFHNASDAFDRLRMSPAHPTFRKLKEQIWQELLAGELRTPTLIIWGREDPEGSFPAGVAMYEALRDTGSPVEFYPFDAAGHVAYMEYPDRFNSVLAAFINRN
jgi:pimeloyl-ACP methyl ester carboxylesterase